MATQRFTNLGQRAGAHSVRLEQPNGMCLLAATSLSASSELHARHPQLGQESQNEVEDLLGFNRHFLKGARRRDQPATPHADALALPQQLSGMPPHRLVRCAPPVASLPQG